MKKCEKPDCPEQKYQRSELCRFHFEEKNRCQEDSCQERKKRRNRFCERHTYCPTPGCPNKRDIGNLHCGNHRLCKIKNCPNNIYIMVSGKSTMCQKHHNASRIEGNRRRSLLRKEKIQDLKKKNLTFKCNNCEKEFPATLCENDRMWCRPCVARKN